jgi:hypothetical protein
MNTDADRLIALERELSETVSELESMTDAYAMARQLVALRDDRLKREHSVLTAGFLRNGEPAGASEHYARADERFREAAQKILKETSDAQKIVTRWDVLHSKFEAVQACLNNERAKMRLI